MATKKTFTGEQILSKGSFYMGYCKELWGSTTLKWVDGILQKPSNQPNEPTNENNSTKPKRTRKAKATV